MKFNYYADTDSLYIELSPKPGFDAEEIVEDVVVDYDKEGNIVGLDIQHASKNFNLSALEIKGFVPKVDIQPQS